MWSDTRTAPGNKICDLQDERPGSPRISIPYFPVGVPNRSGSGGWLGAGDKVRAFAASAPERMEPSKPAGSVTSKKRAPSDADVVKVCGVSL